MRSCRKRSASPSTCRTTITDLNPIGEAFSKVKDVLRKVEGTRTRETLVEALGLALDAVTARDAHGFFAHYRTQHERRAASQEPHTAPGTF